MNQNIVLETCKNIRALARVSLQGKWKLAVAATAVYMVALMLPAAILEIIFSGKENAALLSGLYTFLVAAPFTIGYDIFCLNLFRRKECEIAQVFYGFERFFKAVGLYFVMGLFICLWFLVFIIPGFIAAYRYSQAFLIMIDHPEYGILQCLAESKRLMTGNKMKLFSLEVSFIGWAILASIPMAAISSFFTFNAVALASLGSLLGSIAYFWLSPYLCVASVAFYEIANGNLRPGVIEAEATVMGEEN
ncbi:DUF975 family protein [Aminipila luticellarii]|uniref:DUF975 family protein n=1 Tax=Aminipila luticellarii TaxID=2507160 RepID=A0A410PW03_9FIRM|nr:DUF975 family protein [Aminipila luticellarii]QAT43107.1 DUF975 family protein [Aminipila luticellarii]